jgi:hypothetical protein
MVLMSTTELAVVLWFDCLYWTKKKKQNNREYHAKSFIIRYNVDIETPPA